MFLLNSTFLSFPTGPHLEHKKSCFKVKTKLLINNMNDVKEIKQCSNTTKLSLNLIQRIQRLIDIIEIFQQCIAKNFSCSLMAEG